MLAALNGIEPKNKKKMESIECLHHTSQLKRETMLFFLLPYSY